ncbi:3'-5' exonuclease [Vallitalea guaymasensis]|uniref:NERD domain-containing protein n=1 Tax=Vallitalea guaymasensis TaxID=1185412 RepID=A0A8J8M8F4_9FIRM|nr:3'-5' exonuclease [Vallitalea guaymasensis]QUH28203.1 NERD domain-containing protein [Vallitalea guaymasensis]
MAKIIPQYITTNMTPGEKELLNFLHKLPDDYIVYYTINVNNKEPDFIVVGKKIGVMVIEVKDWDLDYIRRFDKKSVNLKNRSNVKNPLVQAQEYSNELLNIIKDKYIYGYPVNKVVCFCNITYSEYMEFKDNRGTKISDILKPEDIIFKDELQSLKSNTRRRRDKQGKYHIPDANNDYIKLLQDKFYHTFTRDMTDKDVKIFSSAIYPQFIIDDDEPIFKALEWDQILMAKSIPTEHELIRGNAGTGKSIVLQTKALYIASHKPNAKILLIYFNSCIKSHIYAKTKELKYNKQIELNYYESWKEKKGQYDYILVDEGQDFDNGMLKELKDSLKKDGIIVIASDGAQNVYGRQHNLDPDGEDIVIDIKKKVDLLTRNYRTTEEIFVFAYTFLKNEKLKAQLSENKYNSNYSTKIKEHFRSGEMPILKEAKDDDDEYNIIKDHIEYLLVRGELANNIAIIINQNEDIEKYVKRFQEDKYSKVKLYSDKKDCKPEDNEAFIYTRHSAKGLEFKHVILCGIKDDKASTYHKSTFVAMTRAKYSLMIIYKEEAKKYDNVKVIKQVYQELSREYNIEKDSKNRYKLYGEQLLNKMKTIVGIRKITANMDKYTAPEALEIIDRLIDNSFNDVSNFQNKIIEKTNSTKNQTRVKNQHIRSSEIVKPSGEYERDIQVLKKKIEDEKKKTIEKDRKLKTIQKQYKNKVDDLEKELIKKDFTITNLETAATKQDNVKMYNENISYLKDDSISNTSIFKRGLLKKIVFITIGILIFLCYRDPINIFREGHTIGISDDSAVKNNKKTIYLKSTMIPGKDGNGAKVIQSYINIYIDDVKIDELSGFHQSDSMISIEESDSSTELVFNGEIKQNSNSKKKNYESYSLSITKSVKIVYSNTYNSIMINDNSFEMHQLKELKNCIQGMDKLEIGKKNNQIIIEYNN